MILVNSSSFCRRPGPTRRKTTVKLFLSLRVLWAWLLLVELGSLTVSPPCYLYFQVHHQHVPVMFLSALSSHTWLGCEKKYKLKKKVCNEIKLESLWTMYIFGDSLNTLSYQSH